MVERLLTPEQAANRLGIAPRTIREWLLPWQAPWCEALVGYGASEKPIWKRLLPRALLDSIAAFTVPPVQKMKTIKRVVLLLC
jgi:hypothetical protein